MTPKQKLQVVETTIRKALPRLLELTEGCWLNLHYNDEKDNKTTEKCKIIGVDKKGKLLIRFEDGFNTLAKQDLEKYIKIGSYFILGHDILLSDVLEWLGRVEHKASIHSRAEFVVFVKKGKYTFTRYSACIDFSKPYLKDQSEAFWNFLYNLIKDN